MNIIDLLRKLGMLRFGTFSGKYTNAKNMPDELFMENVYDSKKDVWHKEDLDKLGKSPFFFFIVLFVFILFFALFWMVFGLLNIFTLGIILIWGLFLIGIKLRYSLEYASFRFVVLIVGSIILFSVSTLFSTLLNGSRSGQKAGGTARLDSKKVLQITPDSGKARGVVGAEVYSNGKVRAVYHLIFFETLPDNYACRPEVSCSPYTEYTYAGNLGDPSNPNDAGEGSVSALFCNKDKLPTGDEVYSVTFKPWYRESCMSGSDPTPKGADAFYIYFSKNFDSYGDFLKADIFKIHDASKFWEVTSRETTADGGSSITHTVNTDRAVKETTALRTYKFTFKPS